MDCSGEHRYFSVECVGVPSEGKIYVVALCTACGDTFAKDFVVAEPGSELRLFNEEKHTKGK